MGLKYLLVIGAGGFLGTVSRFLVQSYVVRHLPWTFPLGTLLVNVAGCLLIGLLWGFTEKPFHLGATWRFFLATGFCGGFTTFSSFGLENMNLLRQGDYLHFAIYSSLSLLLGIGAVFIGYLMTRNLA